MDLRPELSPPPVSRPRLAGLVTAGAAGADAAITAFNAMTGHDYRAVDFAEYDGGRSLEEFAREADRPARPKVPDVTRGELVEIVRRILTASPESDYYLRLLEANVAHPRIGDLLFHPPARLRSASAEQLVDEALSHRPIAL